MGKNKRKRGATVRLDAANRRVQEARAIYNGSLTGKQTKYLRDWAANNNLVLGRHL